MALRILSRSSRRRYKPLTIPVSLESGMCWSETSSPLVTFNNFALFAHSVVDAWRDVARRVSQLVVCEDALD